MENLHLTSNDNPTCQKKFLYHTTSFGHILRQAKSRGSQDLLKNVIRQTAIYFDIEADGREVKNFLKHMIRVLTIHKWKGFGRLTLDFYHCSRITDGTLKMIASYSARYFSELKRMKLSFSCCGDNITNNGLREVGTTIGRRLWKLKELELDFSLCSKIDDKGTKALMDQMTKSEINLQKLSLRLSNNNITSQTLNTLRSQIGRYLRDLNKLTLNFSQCRNMKEERVKEYLIRMINRLVHLKCLALDFEGCDNSLVQSLKEIQNVISSKHSHLKKIII